VKVAAHTTREIVTAAAVLLALAALAAFSLWGMRPSPATTSAAPVGNAPSAPAPAAPSGEGEGGGD
jgi:hypothetical protein